MSGTSSIRRTTIRAYALGIITGSFLTAGIVLGTAPAKADTPSVNSAERVVCLMIDQDPSFGGIIHTAAILVQEANVTAYQAGQFIAMSITQQCPEHTQLMLDFVKTYSDQTPTNSRIGGKVA